MIVITITIIWLLILFYYADLYYRSLSTILSPPRQRPQLSLVQLLNHLLVIMQFAALRVRVRYSHPTRRRLSLNIKRAVILLLYFIFYWSLLYILHYTLTYVSCNEAAINTIRISDLLLYSSSTKEKWSVRFETVGVVPIMNSGSLEGREYR